MGAFATSWVSTTATGRALGSFRPRGIDAEARRLAEAIAANGPVAVRQAKKAIDGGFDLPMAEALAHEWECYQAVIATEDRIEALRAFAERRPPRYQGR